MQWLKPNKSVCPFCRQNVHDIELFNDFLKEVEKRDGKVIKNQNIRTKDQRISCTCKYEHKFDMSYEKLMIGQWCNICSKGVGERKTRMILEYILNIKLPKANPSWLRSLTTNKFYELDGYNEKHSLAFEYQGPHHYTNKDVIKRDKYKLEKCKEKSVELIVIDQFESHYDDKKIFDILIMLCEEHNLKIVNRNNDIDLSSAYCNDDSMNNRILKLVKKRNAKILEGYQNANVKMTIQCSNKKHKPFSYTPIYILYHKGWCLQCKKLEYKAKKLS